MKQYVERRTAILVDGGYYRKRATALWGRKDPSVRAAELVTYCMLHITEPEDPRDLYRIFYYDCPPMKRTMKHPLDCSEINYSEEPMTKWTNDFYNELTRKMRVALRMGELAESVASYVLKPEAMKALLHKTKSVDDLTKEDFRLDVKQKGVDMRIGLDAATISAGGKVNQIVLIAGDSDFIPVAKLVRRNGVDFILDPMNQSPKQSMYQHVDAIETFTDKMYK